MKEKITLAYTAFSNTWTASGLGCLIAGGVVTTMGLVLIKFGSKLGIYSNEED